LDADVALRPIPCTGALRKVDGRYCTLLKTDWCQPFITLAEMKAIIDPQNWPHLCDFFVRMTPQAKLIPDTTRGWSRVLETVSGDKTQWELRTALKYWKGVFTSSDDISINYDLDDPRVGDDSLVEVDSGYIWITPAVPDDHSKGVRIRTCKAVRICGLSATATAALGCIMGWGDAASQMLVVKAKRPPSGVISFGNPSVDTGPPGVGAGAGAAAARPSSAAVLAAAEKVELPVGWRGALITNVQNEVNATINVAAPLATDLLTRWSDDGLSAEDIKAFGERSGRDLTARAVKMFNAAAGSIRPSPGKTDANEGNCP